MSGDTTGGLTRRDLFRAGAVGVAGYAISADPVLADAIHTDTQGITARDTQVKVGSYDMPVYEAHPAGGRDHPILVVISEIWGVHEYIRDCTRRFAKEGFHAVAPELFGREGGAPRLTQIQSVQDVLKVVLAVGREQILGDVAATVAWARQRPGVKADRVGVTGWCWGGSTTIHVAAGNRDMRCAVAWYGPPGRPYQGASGPVTGFDVAKDITIPFLGLYGEKDTSPTPADAAKFGGMVKAHNPNVDVIIYPNSGHGFHADYRPSYNAWSAVQAWKECVGFLHKNLAA